MATLSVNDNRVLSALFDPEGSNAEATTIDREAASLPGIPEDICRQIRSESNVILRTLDVEHPSTEAISEAYRRISELIDRTPNYAPAYADRAQITRMNLTTSDLFTQKAKDQSHQLLQDLQTAIKLASPSSPNAPLSHLQTQVLASAHTHRGLLLLKVADMRSNSAQLHGVPETLARMEAIDIEGLASKDFYAGGKYGNKVARELSVKTNPYAKMCGAIVREAIQKEIEEADALMNGEFVAP